MKILRGRDKEALLIHQANRAAAVGRLMLGELSSWHEFLMADIIDLNDLPRRKLKSGSADVKSRLNAEITNFCTNNFQNMNMEKLSHLYEKIKALRGLEMPLLQFEAEFSAINPKVLHGCPRHLTIAISLWGLQFRFPEEQISNDIMTGLDIAKNAIMNLKKYEEKPHKQLATFRTNISNLVQERNFSIRAALVGCFNLVEAYLNGLAWDHLQARDPGTLTEKQKALLDDSASVSLRRKLVEYPKELTGGRLLWQDADPEVDQFLTSSKPFRDSLMHPSPFPAPAKYGGHDKLRLFYRLDYNTALDAATLVVSMLKRLHYHIHGQDRVLPTWLKNFDDNMQSNERLVRH